MEITMAQQTEQIGETNKTMTAVEWLFNKIYQDYYHDMSDKEWFELLEQAKVMEKEQIINAHSQGLFGEESNPPISAYSEQYYNETYNK